MIMLCLVKLEGILYSPGPGVVLFNESSLL
jgi:hypothetical protein